MSQVAKDFLEAAAVVQSWMLNKKQRPEYFLRYGICTTLDSAMYRTGLHRQPRWRANAVALWLVESYKKWPEFSGCSRFPVKAPWFLFWRGPVEAYGYYSKRRRMWKGTYGQKRIALFNWLIEKAKKEIEESNHA